MKYYVAVKLIALGILVIIYFLSITTAYSFVVCLASCYFYMCRVVI